MKKKMTPKETRKILMKAFEDANEDVDVDWCKNRYNELFTFLRKWAQPSDLGAVVALQDGVMFMRATNALCREIEREKGIGENEDEELTIETVIKLSTEVISAALNLYALAEGRMMADAERLLAGKPSLKRDDSKDQEETAIICQRADEAGPPVPDSVQGKCSACEASVYMARSSVDYLLKHPKTLIMCIQCGLEKAKTNQVIMGGQVPKT